MRVLVEGGWTIFALKSERVKGEKSKNAVFVERVMIVYLLAAEVGDLRYGNQSAVKHHNPVKSAVNSKQ